jgi:bacterioferritin
MDTENIISKLNWFYSLELNQVDLYKSQSITFKDTYHSKVFKRIAAIEQQHVDNIAEQIKILGGSPTLLGDLIAPITGSLGGTIISLTGIEETLKVNIALEQKAMKDYEDFIHHIKTENNDMDLLNLLQSNYVDEDLHTAWFKDYLTKIK